MRRPRDKRYKARVGHIHISERPWCPRCKMRKCICKDLPKPAPRPETTDGVW